MTIRNGARRTSVNLTDQVPGIDELNFVRCRARGKIVDRVDTYFRPSELKITDGRVVAFPHSLY